jgi:hypothetical protein
MNSNSVNVAEPGSVPDLAKKALNSLEGGDNDDDETVASLAKRALKNLNQPELATEAIKEKDCDDDETDVKSMTISNE